MLTVILAAAQTATAAKGGSLSQAQRARLAELFTLHSDLVWRVLRRQGLIQAQADDALQQVFVVALTKLDAVERGKERAFLCATAVFVARRSRFTPSAEAELPEPAAGGALDEELDAERRRRLLSSVLAGMPEELRLVLVLQGIEGLSKSEVAESLSIPEGTVASRMRRAREVFRAELARRLGTDAGT